MVSKACARTSLSISPFVDVNEANDPRRDLVLKNGIRTDVADGDGGSGAISVDLLRVPDTYSAIDIQTVS